MEFLSVRDFRSASREVWQKLSRDGKMVITNNGKPAALLLDLTNEDLEEMLDTVRQVKAMRLFNKMRREAEKRGFLTDEEIDEEIQAARADMKAREIAV
jgi:PHD/YefM family antitoxin component YafN of YafNO toxin-antitoxin module